MCQQEELGHIFIGCLDDRKKVPDPEPEEDCLGEDFRFSSQTVGEEMIYGIDFGDYLTHGYGIPDSGREDYLNDLADSVYGTGRDWRGRPLREASEPEGEGASEIHPGERGGCPRGNDNPVGNSEAGADLLGQQEGPGGH